MRKILLLFCLLLTGAAWADVAQPELTTDADNPVYYVIRSYRTGNFACYVAEGADVLRQTSEMSKDVLWYFEAAAEGGGGVNIVPAGAPGLKLASTSEATAEGAVWYVKENPYNTGYFCISLSDNLSSDCWDDQSGGIGTWQPAADDFAGTSWILEKVNIEKDQLDNASDVLTFDYVTKPTALNNLAGLEGLASYADNLAAVRAATSEAELKAAFEGFAPLYVTLQCQNTHNYFKAGETQASFVASPADYEHVIQLVPVGDGSFYLKGFKSKTYVGDVQTSKQILITAEPEIPFYIQKYDDYVVVRPTKYSDDSQNYIHNNGCVGWGRAAVNSQHILAEIDVPDYETLLAETLASAKALFAFEGVPGYPTAAALAALQTAIDEAEAATGDAEAAYDALNAAVAAAWSDINYVPATGRYYTITNARGAMVYDPAHDDSADETNDNAKYIWYKDSDVDNTDQNNLWGFIEKDGNHYMYNVGKRQFAAIGKGTYGATWIFSDKPAYITTDAGISDNIAAPSVRVRATDVSGNTYTMSVSPNYAGPVITYDAQGDGGVPMLFAVSPAEVDAEVTAAIEELLGDVTPYREALEAAIAEAEALNIGPGLGQYSGEGFADALAAARAALEDADATKESLVEARTVLEDALVALELNLPADGALLRIKGATSGKYLAAGNASNGKFNMSDATDATTIFYYTGGKLINYASGLYNGMNATSWNWTGEASASDVTFADGGTYGGYTILSLSAYFYDAGDADASSADRGQTLNNDVRYRSWQLEEVEALPVVVSEDGLATLYAPFSLSVPEGVTACTVTLDEEKAQAVLAEVSEIPAGTGVVLKAAAGTYDFPLIALDAATVGVLTGSAATADFAAGAVYTLAAGEDAGFYPTTDATTVKGFTAFLPAEATGGADAYVFEVKTPTSIAAVAADRTDAAAYDLSGRRVSKAARGLYIVGGEKVLVK